MNYIIHLNAFLERASKEEWMVPHHYSLYMTLFNHWNKVGFRKTFHIFREQIMSAAKITSQSTYYRILRELEAGQYLQFHTSSSRFVQASVTMTPLGIVQASPTAPATTSPGNVQAPHKEPLLQTNIKLISNEVSNGAPSLDDVLKFAMIHQYNSAETLKFWYHHEATNWLTGNTPVQHWQPLLHKWMLNLKSTNNDKTPDYNEPF